LCYLPNDTRNDGYGTIDALVYNYGV